MIWLVSSSETKLSTVWGNVDKVSPVGVEYEVWEAPALDIFRLQDADPARLRYQ
jgi:hypothetical protein